MRIRRNGAKVGDLLAAWKAGGRGGWKPFLHHISKGKPYRRRAITLKVPAKLPPAITPTGSNDPVTTAPATQDQPRSAWSTSGRTDSQFSCQAEWHWILTRGYERLTLSGASLAAQSSPAILNDLLDLELSQRVDDLEGATRALDEVITRLSGAGMFAVADTSVYIEHEQKLEDLDFVPLLSIWEDPVRILVPIIIVDELEGVKRRGDHSG